jgi:hypothetical protein
MADEKITIDIEAKIDAAQSIKDLKELKLLQRQVAAGSPEFAKLANAIDDLEDSIKGAKKSSADWIDTLESAGGPIGMLGGALNKAKVATVSFGSALKAAGIGLIVSAVAGLVAAFSNVEGATKKLEPLLIGFEKILGGIFEALTPLIDSFIELATQALPYITKGISIFYSSLVGLFTLVKEGGAGIGKILKGIFTLDTKAIQEGFDQLKGSWSKTVDAYNATSERFEAGTKKLTKTQKENLKTQNEDAKKALDEKIKRLEAEDKLDEAKLKKLKEEALVLATTEQEKLDVEKKFAELSYKAKIKDLDDKMTLYKKDSVEYKNLQSEKINAEAEYINQTTSFAEKQKTIDDNTLKEKKAFEERAKEIRDSAIKDETDKALAQRQSKYQKDLVELEADKQFILKSESEKNELRKLLAQGLQNDLDKIKTDARSKELASQLLLDEARLKVLQEGTAEYFTQQRVLENDAFEAQKLKARDNAVELEAIETTHKANLKNIDKAEFEAKKDLQLQIVNLYGGFGKALQELAGKNKKLAIAGLLIEQAAGVASIIINTQKAAAKAGYFTPLGIATLIAGAASVVAAVVATAKGIQQINQVQTPGASGGGGSAGGGGASIQAPTAPSAPAPQIQTTGGMNPTTQIAQTIGNVQAPIRAYVVSQDISSQQALDRRTNRAATFSAG